MNWYKFLLKLSAPPAVLQPPYLHDINKKQQKIFNYLKSTGLTVDLYHGTSAELFNKMENVGYILSPSVMNLDEYEDRKQGLDQIFYSSNPSIATYYSERAQGQTFSPAVLLTIRVPMFLLSEVHAAIFNVPIYNEQNFDKELRRDFEDALSQGEDLKVIVSNMKDRIENSNVELTTYKAVSTRYIEQSNSLEGMNNYINNADKSYGQPDLSYTIFGTDYSRLYKINEMILNEGETDVFYDIVGNDPVEMLKLYAGLVPEVKDNYSDIAQNVVNTLHEYAQSVANEIRKVSRDIEKTGEESIEELIAQIGESPDQYNTFSIDTLNGIYSYLDSYIISNFSDKVDFIDDVVTDALKDVVEAINNMGEVDGEMVAEIWRHIPSRVKEKLGDSAKKLFAESVLYGSDDLYSKNNIVKDPYLADHINKNQIINVIHNDMMKLLKMYTNNRNPNLALEGLAVGYESAPKKVKYDPSFLYYFTPLASEIVKKFPESYYYLYSNSNSMRELQSVIDKNQVEESFKQEVFKIIDDTFENQGLTRDINSLNRFLQLPKNIFQQEPFKSYIAQEIDESVTKSIALNLFDNLRRENTVIFDRIYPALPNEIQNNILNMAIDLYRQRLENLSQIDVGFEDIKIMYEGLPDILKNNPQIIQLSNEALEKNNLDVSDIRYP